MTPEHLADPGNAHLVECVAPLAEQDGRVKMVDTEYAVDEHISFIPTPGHTPGHVAIGIMSDGSAR